jgi:hypothetical protein
MKLGTSASVFIVLQGAACVGRLDVGRVGDSADGGLTESVDAGGNGNNGDVGDGDVGDGQADAGLVVSGPPPDNDAAVEYAPPGRAGFALLVNGVLQLPMSCPSDNWEFPPTTGTTAALPVLAATCPAAGMCPGVTSVQLMNSSAIPMAYIAAGTWSVPGHYEPGLPTGAPDQLYGVLDPGESVDITSVYDGGITALLGSADPFSAPGKDVSDEGTIPWPAGVRGSGGAQEMSLAEVNVYGACGGTSPLF